MNRTPNRRVHYIGPYRQTSQENAGKKLSGNKLARKKFMALNMAEGLLFSVYSTFARSVKQKARLCVMSPIFDAIAFFWGINECVPWGTGWHYSLGVMHERSGCRAPRATAASHMKPLNDVSRHRSMSVKVELVCLSDVHFLQPQNGHVNPVMSSWTLREVR